MANAAEVRGKIVLIDRGTSTFIDKVTKGFNAGAIAVIVDNFNNPTDDPIVMSTAGQPPGVDVMISKASRDAIVAAAGSFNAATGVPTNTVNVTIKNDNDVITCDGTSTADTMPAYSARGPRLGDSALKPDVSAPAEVVGVATTLSGSDVRNFNGTSSATPHVAGSMALLKQLHPDWSVQDLNGVTLRDGHERSVHVDKPRDQASIRTGTVSLPLAGVPVNTGVPAARAPSTEIVSLVKPFELQ